MDLKKRDTGFTLIELSVVIVLIGLIVASVLGGKSLIDQAKLKSVITDFNNYETAINAFKLEYGSLPGDLRRATSYWPSAGTADGNGNKRIEIAGGVTVNTESTYVWQQLSLAGLIEGAYEGGDLINGGCSCPARYVIGRNAVLAPLNSGNNFYSIYLNTGSGLFFNTVLGAEGNNINISSNPIAEGASLTTKQAHGIDNKLDDGLPRTGVYVAENGRGGATWPETTTSNCVSGSEYDFTQTTIQCRLVHWIN